MNEERIDYSEIRESFLDNYYVCCRHKILSSNMSGGTWGENESEVGYAYYQSESAYELPIENLMLEVFTLIMRAGRGPVQADKSHRKKIAEILAEYPLDELLKEISAEELKELLYDMSLLGLIDK